MFVTWIHAYLSRADQNRDDKMSYEEVQMLLQMINIDLSEQYARSLFQVLVVHIYHVRALWRQTAKRKVKLCV